MHKLIKKYQQPWGNGIQSLPSWDQVVKSLTDIKSQNDQINSGLNTFNNAIIQNVNTSLYGQNSLSNIRLQQKFNQNQVNPNTLKPKSIIGEIKSTDSKKIDNLALNTSVTNDLKTRQTASATKTENISKFNKGVGIAADLAPFISQGAQSVVTSFGGTVADSETSKGLSMIGNIVGMIPGVGPWAKIGLEAAGAINNIVGGSLSKKAGTTQQVNLDGIGSGHTGITGSDAIGSKTFGWSDKKKMLNFASDKNNVIQQAGLAKEIGKQQNQVKDSSLDFKNQLLFNNQFKLNGGFNTNALMAKNGTKLKFSNIKNSVNNKIKQSKVEEIIEDVEKFEEGGKINVIPEGALHARKHNLPEEIAEFVTDKGIPVITMEEGGEIEQHAEIEVNEIIFNKELTVKLEDMWEQYKNGDDSIAIKAGKLLTYEILENTKDMTNLINSIN